MGDDDVPAATAVLADDIETREGGGHVVVYFVGCDGGTASAALQPDGQRWLWQILRAHCCPCFVGGVLSRERIAEYRRLLLRFSFHVSLLQIVMLVVALAAGGGFAPLAENALLGPTTTGLLRAGAKYSFAIVHKGHVHRLFTPVLLHAGLIHIAVNLFAQLRLGLYAEQKWGVLLYSALFLLSGVGGVLLSALLSPTSISVGASGATAGVLAALAIHIGIIPDPRDPLRQFSVLLLVLISVVLIFLGVSPRVDFSAHLGGALVGSLFALAAWGGRATMLANWARVRKATPFFFGLLILLYFIICIAELFTSTVAEPLFSDDAI